MLDAATEDMGKPRLNNTGASKTAALGKEQAMSITEKINLQVPIRHMGELFTWGEEERQLIAQAAVEILDKVGMKIQGEDNLRMIEQAGGRVNWETNTVHFSEEETLATARKLAESSPARGRVDLLTCERPTSFGVGNGGSLWFDWECWKAVPATRRDLRNLTRWAEGMDQVSSSAQFCLVQEKGLDPVLQLVDAFAIMFQHSTKPVQFDQPTEPIHVKYLQRLQELQHARGYRQSIAPYEWVTPPLRLGDRAIKATLARVEAGIDPIGMGSMVTSGVGAPATVPGFAAMGAAEVLGALGVVRWLCPQVGLTANITGGVMDMQTGQISYQVPWSAVAHYAAVDVFQHVFGAHLGHYRGYRDANEPGMQACYEWALLNLFHGCVGGEMQTEVGGLANGNLFSPEQAVLDMAMVGEANQFFSGFEFNERAIGLDLILEARHDAKAYLTHQHTLDHFRDMLPFSNYWLRGLPATAQHDSDRSQTQRLLDQAHEICVEARQRGEEVETNQELADEAWQVVRDMAQELGVRAPDPLID